MDRANQLGEEKVGKLLLKFSIPAIVGMLVNALYNVIDRIFVGQGVGSLALSGIAVAFPIAIIIIAFVVLIGIGATSLISIRLGEGNKEEAEVIVGNSFVLLVLVSLVLSVVASLITILFNKSLATYGGDQAIAAMGIIIAHTFFRA